LFLSQPAVSASLNRLRQVFDDPLFRRTGHGVTPTPRALAMAAQVDMLLVELSALVAGDAEFDPAVSNRVFRIAGSDFPSQRFLPPLAQRLAAAGSAVRIVWEPPGAGLLADRLERGELDLAVVARVQMTERIESATLYEDAYVYALRAGHPRAAERPTLHSFCEIPQVFLGYGTSVLDDLIDATLARQGLRRRVQVAVTSFAQIVHLLEHSDHAAVLGGRVAASFGDRLRVQPLPFELPRYRSLVCWPARTAHDAGLRWLRDQLLDIAAGTP
jgi:DNA-binding transcriptional LysR family regulator